MLTKVITASLSGVEGYMVSVETDVHKGMPGIHIVGLADTMIREAYRRIRPAIVNSGYRFPNESITVNLVPANRHKVGSHFDLPMAAGIIMSLMQVDCMENTAFFGEVSLDGRINPVKGILPMLLALRKQGITNVVLPSGNAEEASILKDINILPVNKLEEVAVYISGEENIRPYSKIAKDITVSYPLDYSQVIGQENVKRAMMIAAAGHHGALMVGSPGCGKTMMAKRLPTIMPEMTYEEKLEITSIYSVAGMLAEEGRVLEQRPFRAPHHTITPTGLIGGGARPKPGEISLAHNGVLFLDELGEFEMRSIDAMRQPVEDGFIKINRINEEVVFPSEVLLVIASNPCKCGHLWDEEKICTCSKMQLNNYHKKLMGPFADRIDMHIRVNPVDIDELGKKDYRWMSSEEMRNIVIRAREIQKKRYEWTSYRFNGSLDEAAIKEYCSLSDECERMLNMAFRKYKLSMRARGKIIKLARTIADIDNEEIIRSEHIAEAILYRGIK